MEEVLITGLKHTSAFDCMFGFFGSAALKSIAPGLAAYLAVASQPLRLIASPNISAEDAVALRQGVSTPSAVLEARLRELLGEARLSSSAIVNHTLACLAYMLATDRLQMRLALLRDGSLFHSKVWIFRDGLNRVVAHGSSNLTHSGLETNHEQIRVEASWDGQKAQETISALTDEFSALWDGDREYIWTLDLPVAIEHDLVRDYAPERPPTMSDFRAAWEEDNKIIENLQLPLDFQETKDTLQPSDMKQLAIPGHLDLESGPFAHQGRAIATWQEANWRGIWAMATGSGKTVAALAAATRLKEQVQSLLIVISAPYRPLVAQWMEEVRSFGVSPLQTDGSADMKAQRLAQAVHRLQSGESQVEVQVVTVNFLTCRPFRQVLDALPESITSLLIADEVHNLGQPRFLTEKPHRFDHRLGLSATPDRQYDAEGTESLIDFFGPIIFEFTLADAIGVCLVPYEYFIHPVTFAEEEYEKWKSLTERLYRLGVRADIDPDEAGELGDRELSLLMARRRLVESAKHKVEALHRILKNRSRDGIRNTLVYATDKNKAQLRAVNHMLQHQLQLTIHEFTAQETASRARSAILLDRFAAGDYQILTCMRVLDEGVDIPQVSEAFLLASNTVRRQWIQRRGRVLRKCEAIQKRMARLHDFIVVPPDLRDPGAKTILSGELDRAREFAALADNGGTPGGPIDEIESLMQGMFA